MRRSSAAEKVTVIRRARTAHAWGALAFALVVGMTTTASPSRLAASSAPRQHLVLNSSMGGRHDVIAADAGFVYLADGLDVSVVDARDPEHLAEVKRIRLPHEAPDLVARDRRLYIAAGGAGLLVFSLDDPAAPRLVGQTPILTNRLAVAGTFVYTVGCGMGVVDVTDATSPRILRDAVCDATTTITGGASNGSIFADGRRIFRLGYPSHGIPINTSYLVVYDAANPSAPERAGATIAITGTAVDVAGAGDLVYVTNSGGLLVFDIHDPKHPTLLATLDGVNNGQLTLEGPVAYVAAQDLVGIDIAKPREPKVVSRSTPLGGAASLAIDGGQLFVVGSSGLWAFRNPPGANFRPLGQLDLLANVRSVERSGDYAFTVGTTDLQVMDLLSPSGPKLAARLALGGLSLAISGSHAFVTTHDQLTVVDVADPLRPRLQASIAISDADTYGDVAASGQAVYVGDRSLHKMAIIDVSNPNAPARAATYELASGAVLIALEAENQTVYLADRDGALTIVDVVDLSVPQTVAGVANLGDIQDMSVDEGLVAVASNCTDGLKLIDARVPDKPQLMATVTEWGIRSRFGRFCPRRVKLSGRRLWAISNDRYVSVLDVSQPEQPRFLAANDLSLMPTWAPKALAAFGDAAFVSSSYSGLYGLALVDLPFTAILPSASQKR